MTIFKKAIFNLHSGRKSSFKIDCDDLTDEDLDCLAYLVSLRIDFGTVHGIPEGGLRFAEALKNYAKPDHTRVLIADDVMTTGQSIAGFAANVLNLQLSPDCHGVVIFNRYLEHAQYVHSIFTLNPVIVDWEHKTMDRND